MYCSVGQIFAILCHFTGPPLVKPRPPTATSIPAILKGLQDEWVRNIDSNSHIKSSFKELHLKQVILKHSRSRFEKFRSLVCLRFRVEQSKASEFGVYRLFGEFVHFGKPKQCKAVSIYKTLGLSKFEQVTFLYNLGAHLNNPELLLIDYLHNCSLYCDFLFLYMYFGDVNFFSIH